MHGRNVESFRKCVQFGTSETRNIILIILNDCKREKITPNLIQNKEGTLF